MDLPERRTLERGALVTALVLLFGRTEAEAESRVRGELLADLHQRARPRPRPVAASGPGSRAPTSTAISSSRSPSPPRRRRSCRSPGSPRASLASCRASAGPTTGSRWCSRHDEPLASGRGAARAAGRRHRRRRHAVPEARVGITAGLARGPADARRAAPAGPHGRGQRPGRPRARAAAARRQRSPGPRGVRRPDAGPGAATTTPSATPSSPRPWRRGSPPGAACGRPPSGCTSTRTR